ncbi:MAG: hypothetical protein NC336_00470 [Clostridium sp.]|nr:hypothetical protein [Clostridium sp.]
MKKTPFLWIIISLAVVLLLAVGFAIYKVGTLSRDLQEAELANEQLQLTNEQLQLSNEYEAINSEFAQYEEQVVKVQNDTILAKYTAAKAKIEELLKELNSQKVKSQKRIAELQNEIATLRSLLKHYIAQVDSLGKENAGLKAEVAEVRDENRQLSSRVQQVSRQNETLNERMTLAEKLNVTGLSLTSLKKNGKTEKNITKAKQLMITFTIPQNNSTPVGEKTIYARIVSPEGTVLGNGGTFPFEGGNVACTARKSIEYAGEEISGIHIYWDVNTVLTPGDYTVELFADNYRLISRKFTMKK